MNATTGNIVGFGIVNLFLDFRVYGGGYGKSMIWVLFTSHQIEKYMVGFSNKSTVDEIRLDI
jgi:hypothetical protein